MPTSRAARSSRSGVATIRDVARRAQVSVASVSRVMTDSPRVSEEMSRVVLAAAAALDFRPNFLGRSLRSNRTHKIGVVLPTLSHPVFAECLQGLEDAARQGEHAVVVTTTGYDPAQEDRAVETLLRHRVDGLVLTVANAARNRALDKLDRERVPYVLVYNQLGRASPARSSTPSPDRSKTERPTVSVDNRAAARQMVEHLIGLGHRGIAMVAGSFRQSDRARLRHRGYQDAMRAAGLPPLPPLELPFMTIDMRAALQDLLASRQPPSAVFCSSDQLAMRVMRDLGRLGWKVPMAISVAGFDGVELGTLTSPALSSVVQPSRQIAGTAIDLLMRRISGEQEPSSALLPHTLRLGESTAAAPPLPTPLSSSAPRRARPGVPRPSIVSTT